MELRSPTRVSVVFVGVDVLVVVVVVVVVVVNLLADGPIRRQSHQHLLHDASDPGCNER
jgi:hypothetical protein